jgi:hypothetical protein
LNNSVALSQMPKESLKVSELVALDSLETRHMSIWLEQILLPRLGSHELQHTESYSSTRRKGININYSSGIPILQLAASCKKAIATKRIILWCLITQYGNRLPCAIFLHLPWLQDGIRLARKPREKGGPRWRQKLKMIRSLLHRRLCFRRAYDRTAQHDPDQVSAIQESNWKHGSIPLRPKSRVAVARISRGVGAYMRFFKVTPNPPLSVKKIVSLGLSWLSPP